MEVATCYLVVSSPRFIIYHGHFRSLATANHYIIILLLCYLTLHSLAYHGGGLDGSSSGSLELASYVVKRSVHCSWPLQWAGWAMPNHSYAASYTMQ